MLYIFGWRQRRRQCNEGAHGSEKRSAGRRVYMCHNIRNPFYHYIAVRSRAKLVFWIIINSSLHFHSRAFSLLWIWIQFWRKAVICHYHTVCRNRFLRKFVHLVHIHMHIYSSVSDSKLWPSSAIAIAIHFQQLFFRSWSRFMQKLFWSYSACSLSSLLFSFQNRYWFIVAICCCFFFYCLLCSSPIMPSP